MPQRVFCFVVVLKIFFNGEIFAQKISTERIMGYRMFCLSDTMPQQKFFTHSRPILQGKQIDDPGSLIFGANPVVLKPVPIDFYSRGLGFVCRQEMRLEKAVSVPFRLRLGSPDYVNYLEQKPNALKPR